MKDAVETMGGVLPEDAGGRDAVHVAVFSASADEKLYPGQDIAVLSQGEPDAKVTSKGETVAIVDPFLRAAVPPGVRFWAYLYPRTITALSHRWSHPAFEQSASVYVPPSDKLKSEQWLRDFTRTADCPGYEEVMAKAKRIIQGRNDAFSDEYMHFDGLDAHGDIPDEFWQHAEVVLGIKRVGPVAKYFSCSC